MAMIGDERFEGVRYAKGGTHAPYGCGHGHRSAAAAMRCCDDDYIVTYRYSGPDQGWQPVGGNPGGAYLQWGQ